MIRLGIDIGGSAIKAALVNLDTGEKIYADILFDEINALALKNFVRRQR